MTGTLLMGRGTKKELDRLTVKIEGDGPVGGITAHGAGVNDDGRGDSLRTQRPNCRRTATVSSTSAVSSGRECFM